MGRGYLSEPDGGSVVQDEAHDGLVHGQQGFSREASARPSQGFHDFKGSRGMLDTVAGVRAEGEVGIQRDSQDFRCTV